MKRNSISKKIISLLLVALMLSSVVVYSPVETTAEEYSDSILTYSTGFPRDDANTHDPSRQHEGFGTIGGGLCVNGTEFKASAANSLFFLNSSYTKLAYCIELGVDVVKDRWMSNTKETDACETLAKRVRDGVTKVSGMTTERMKALLRSILGYGYAHDGSCATDWKFANSLAQLEQGIVTADAYKFSYAYATQLLVWELVMGERDENFNHIDVSSYGYMSVYAHSIKNNNPLKGIIDEYYRQIEANVKGVTPNAGIDQVFELTANDAKQVMETVIPDANGFFKTVTEIPGITGASITHDGSNLIISIPYRYAKEGEYQVPYSIKRKEPAEVKFYISGDKADEQTQDMVTSATVTGGFAESSVDSALTLRIPHHHEWVPHVIIPTCTTEGLTCMMCKCGQIYTEKVTSHLDHNYTSSAWVIGHQATCTEDGELVQICERCNTVIDSKVIPKTGHNGVWIIESEATADHDGQMVLHCTKCGNRTETKTYEKHSHEFGYDAVVREATCATEGLSGKFCKSCGVCYDTSTIAAGHSEDLVWVTTLQPTCTDKGESVAFCSDCGDMVATKDIESTGHSTGTWITSIAPFCGLAGEEVCFCDKCGEIIDSRETAALEHDAGVWKTTKNPTCELDGEKTKSCTRCGHVIETEAIEALGHDDGVWKVDIEATADVDGILGCYCTRCSMVLDTQTFTLHTHEEGFPVTLLQPTCTRNGEKGTVCRLCNAVFVSETTDALGHDYSEFYTESNGTHSMSCSRCHYVYTENCDYEVIEDRKATCTTAGLRTSQCTVCEYTFSDSFVPPFGHTLGKWVSEGKSTHMRYCTDCGVMEISKHIWGNYISNNDGDIIEEGSKTRYCIYCAESQTIGKPAEILKSTYKAAMTFMEFLNELFRFLGEFFDILSQFIESIKDIT